MNTNKKESLLIASGVYILTTSAIEALRWLGYMVNVTPGPRTAIAAALGIITFALVYYLRGTDTGKKPGQN